MKTSSGEFISWYRFPRVGRVLLRVGLVSGALSYSLSGLQEAWLSPSLLFPSTNLLALTGLGVSSMSWTLESLEGFRVVEGRVVEGISSVDSPRFLLTGTETDLFSEPG